MPRTGLETTSDEALLMTFRHELFHLISRRWANQRPQLYALANFQPAPPRLKWPLKLSQSRISNPDAPLYDYVLHHGNERYLPVLHFNTALASSSGPEDFTSRLRLDYYLLLAGDSNCNQQAFGPGGGCGSHPGEY
ncbi:MAG: hypothetical protein HC821_00730 [Lewinella sp.]|nr:hypothetical protein [Lewinella sp.]